MAKYKCPVCSVNCESEEGCFKHKKRKPLKSSSRLKPKKKTKEEIQQNQEDKDKMWALFNELWNSLPEDKRCWSCGTRIWGDNLSLYWDHLLEKAVYEELKYEKENLYFCCGDCHTKKSNSHPTEKHQQAIEQAKKRFNIK